MQSSRTVFDFSVCGPLLVSYFTYDRYDPPSKATHPQVGSQKTLDRYNQPSEATYPPVGMVQRKRKLLHNSVSMVGAMWRHFRPRSETAEAEIEVGTHSTLDANRRADVSLAEVAVVQGPARAPHALARESSSNLNKAHNKVYPLHLGSGKHQDPQQSA